MARQSHAVDIPVDIMAFIYWKTTWSAVGVINGTTVGLEDRPCERATYTLLIRATPLFAALYPQSSYVISSPA